VISAIGNFVLAKDPQIAGLEEFGGKLLRSGAWDHDYDIAGKRVAVIGTGASAVQIVPSIAEHVAQLDVYQRTPIWIVPKIDPAMRPRIRRLFRRFPRTQRSVSDGLRSLMEFLLIKGVLNYEARGTRRAVRAIEWLLRDVFYRRCVPDPELRRRLTPQYGFGCKRPALSSTYLRTFNRPDVELVTDPIETLTATGIRTRDGRERPVDAIVLATGFHMAHEPELYRREPVRGRAGFDLATQYADHRARSYEGITVPRLPNHLFIYGPYGGTGGTYHEVVKAGAIHILRLLAEADRRGATCVEVTDEATDRWTAFAQARMAPTLFNHNNCANSNSYYFDPNGDIPFLRPTSAAEAVDAHGRFPFDDYVFSREQHRL
jgi:cation diffusion facilitator CzcD-associated flavoprotein CzcO